jgi:hypothetical protein
VSFPVEELQPYETVAVVKIDKVEPLEPAGRYAPPFRASGTVVKPLKGKLRCGEVIQGVTQRDVEAYARCPIRLKEGSTYLLFLHGSNAPYVVPRYGSLYVADQDDVFNGYVAAIEKASGAAAEMCGGATGPAPGKRAGTTGWCSAAPASPEQSGIVGWLVLAGTLAWVRAGRRSFGSRGEARAGSRDHACAAGRRHPADLLLGPRRQATRASPASLARTLCAQKDDGARS